MISHATPKLITQEIATHANELKKLQKDAFVASLLDSISEFKQIPPDDWAYAQASLDEKSESSQFFAKYRNQISRQFEADGKKLTAVPIITFTFNGELYVLLMENKHLEKSVEVNEIQWTAHGVRVDAIESDFLMSDAKLLNLLEKISHGDSDVLNLLAATIRRVRGLGIELTEKDILNIKPINRVAAGFPETSKDYRTEYYNVDLGERNPDELVKLIESAKKMSRYAEWTECFKIADLKGEVKETKAEVKDEKLDPVILSRRRYRYTLTHAGKTLPIRVTTLEFLRALEYVKLTEISPDAESKDPWTMRNLSGIERALLWVAKRMDGNVQFSLFAQQNNRLSSAQAHAYAAKAGMNEENLAYTAMRPHRLVLNAIIAYLTVHVKVKDSIELGKFCNLIKEKFFNLNKNFIEFWKQNFEKCRQI